MSSPFPFSDEELSNEVYLRRSLDSAANDFAVAMHEDASANRIPLDTVEEQNLGLMDISPALARGELSLSSLSRPGLRRDDTVPAPRQPPPPAPLGGAGQSNAGPDGDQGQGDDGSIGDPTDSLSLVQLRSLVKDLPRIEPTPYAFEYADAASLPEEIEEWFSYSVEERARILKGQSSFAQEWGEWNGWGFAEEGVGLDWSGVGEEERSGFVRRLVACLREGGGEKRLRALEALVYLVLGCWHETAGLTQSEPERLDKGKGKATAEESGQSKEAVEASPTDASPLEPLEKALEERFNKSQAQIYWIKSNVNLLFDCDGLQTVFNLVRDTCLRECSDDPTRESTTAVQREAEQRETWCALTVFYICLEVCRACEDEERRVALRGALVRLEHNVLIFLCNITNTIRWDDTIQLPLIKLLLLMWKSILVSFGGLNDVEKAKVFFREPMDEGDTSGKPMITASPLDYHAFRQEISSKYPAFNPPPPLFPLEADEKTILPPLRVNPTKSANGTTAQAPTHGHSILHQPVHIATPAPSPPPSPAGGGKGGKKQNYQTNQLFPFLYPPLDETSNQLGGKGATDLQDALVGRKWEGSDIPASILEAAELFSKRMRATRAMKQLWEERVSFMKFERGWEGIEDPQKVEKDKEETIDSEGDKDDDITDVESLDLDLDGLDLDSDGEIILDAPVKEEKPKKVEEEAPPPLLVDGSVDDRLQKVENFYRDGLPHLQSLIMVLLKTILANVTSLIQAQAANGQNGVHGSFSVPEGQSGIIPQKPETNSVMNGLNLDAAHVSTEELDAVRSQEITAKAASGILVLLLKWFKISHILKFEYLTQLLIDANYVPMILKLLQTQEVERIVNYRSDREDLNFFYYCRAHSRVGLDELPEEPPHDLSDSSSDGAAPPPIIKRHREVPPPEPPSSAIEAPSNNNPFTPGTPAVPFPPEVDELGVPTSEMPPEPITTFSWRNFFSSINFLRILQKCCKGKAHRNLMLVTYKSSAILKKSLKVPQPELRLYTLKLFKGQVPFCGRKWRQSNMRVITAVYLHCQPELRDEWLVSADVDGEVEMAVPMEQALRALTHWFNVKNYPDGMGATRGLLEEEQDFFVRELDKLDWGEVEAQGFSVDGESVGEWQGEKLQLEGW